MAERYRCPLCGGDLIIVHRTDASAMSHYDYWIMTCGDCDWIIFADTREELIENYREAINAGNA